MFGYQAHEVIGQPVALIIPAERLDEEEQVLERLKRGESIVHYETARLTKGGKRLDVSMTISPIKDNHGRIVGASRIAHDIGEIVRGRQLLAQSKQVLEQLVEVRTAKLKEAMSETGGDVLQHGPRHARPAPGHAGPGHVDRGGMCRLLTPPEPGLFPAHPGVRQPPGPVDYRRAELQPGCE